MSPAVINGRSLGVERNGYFTAQNTDPIPGGRLWTEAALTWNVMRVDALLDGIEPWEFMPAGPASSARAIYPCSQYGTQCYFWNHQPPPAAYPGTSNHGWAIAVDVKTRRATAWLMKNGHKYGWSWDEGRRVGEWWHWRFVHGLSRRRMKKMRKRWTRHQHLAQLWKDERSWVVEYDRLVKRQRLSRKKRNRIEYLRRQMVERRRRIWKTAQKKGWKGNRRQRYLMLKARTR